jgi:hypothetical protein
MAETKKKKRKKRESEKVRVVAFPPMFTWWHLGTPKSGGVNNNPGPPAGPGGRDAQGMPTPVLSPATPAGEARQDAIAGMRRALLKENDPQWAGFQVPMPGMVKMRQGGPSLSGPGFDQPADPLPGGVYDTQKSPGLGFRSEGAWRIWRAATEIMSREKTLPPMAILQAAMARAGVRMGELDPAEVRLVTMGIEWNLTDPKASPSRREW